MGKSLKKSSRRSWNCIFTCDAEGIWSAGELPGDCGGQGAAIRELMGEVAVDGDIREEIMFREKWYG